MGYANLSTTKSGAKMIAPTFLQVASSTGCTLADLSVTGYDTPVYDPEMDETDGGCLGGHFVVQILNGNGSTKAAYYWIDDDNGHKGWYATMGGAEIDGGASSVSLNAGQSLWTAGRGYSLVSSGQVGTADIVFTTTSSGAVALGNGTPVDLTLNKLYVTGYKTPVYDPEMDETDGGCLGGHFVVQFLTTSGATSASYYWIDDDNGHNGWYGSMGGSAIEDGASSVSIPAGQGLWVAGRGYSLRIPAPEL